MNKFIAIVLLLFFFSPKIYSQSKEKNYKIEIHTTPSTMFDFTPRLRMGVEYQQSDKFAYSLDFGLGNYFLNQYILNDDDLKHDYRFWEIRPELKYYFFKPNNVVSMYCAAELFYLKNSSTIYDSYYYTKNSSLNINYDRATFQKQKMGAHIKAGLKLVANNKISFDFYVGGGIAYRTINYTNIINPRFEEANETDNEWWDFGLGTKEEGNMKLFHVSLGFKLGYIF